MVKITTYVTDVRYRMDFRVVRDEFFGTRGPASTMVQVASLSHPDDMIEVEALAVIEHARGAPRLRRDAEPGGVGGPFRGPHLDQNPRAMKAATKTIRTTTAISAWVTA